jgi:recombination protein RecA
MPPKKPTEKPAAKKTAKKAAKKKTAVKKKTTKKGGKKKSSNPLAAGRALLKTALSGDYVVDLDPKSARKSMDVLSTGSRVLNHLIGGKLNAHGVPPCPGVPRGKILNLYGPEGSGKTTIALQTAVETIKQGGTVCYVDWEHEIVPEYAMALGVPIGDPDKFMLVQPDTLDDGVAIVWTMATHGVDLIVLDSVGAGVPKAFFEKSLKDTAAQGRVGMNAAVWSAFLPRLKGRINKTKSAVIGIAQMRDSINTMGYGDQFTVQGGKAWKYYSALRVRLKKVGTEKASQYSALSAKTDNRVVGAKIRAKLDKCKVSAQQGNEEDFYIRWGLGVDDLRSLIEIGLAHNVIKKKGAWYRWIDIEGEEVGKNGMEKLRGFFDTNAQALKLLERQVMPFMAVGGSDDGADDEDELDLFGAEPFQDDSELKDILSSISTVPDDDPTDG